MAISISTTTKTCAVSAHPAGTSPEVGRKLPPTRGLETPGDAQRSRIKIHSPKFEPSFALRADCFKGGESSTREQPYSEKPAALPSFALHDRVFEMTLCLVFAFFTDRPSIHFDPALRHCLALWDTCRQKLAYPPHLMRGCRTKWCPDFTPAASKNWPAPCCLLVGQFSHKKVQKKNE